MDRATGTGKCSANTYTFDDKKMYREVAKALLPEEKVDPDAVHMHIGKYCQIMDLEFSPAEASQVLQFLKSAQADRKLTRDVEYGLGYLITHD
jgi:diaminopimelate decarboxylase